MAVNLKLGDRLAIIRDGVKKGYTPQEAMLQYQINKDGGYNNWKNQFKLTTGINPDLDDTYNYELFFKENPEAAKLLILGEVSPDVLQMYKTPLAIQREKQVLQQRQRGNINSLMDYAQYEKLINDYMNKSVNVSSCGGPVSINMYAEGTDNLNEKRTDITKFGTLESKYRDTRTPNFIDITPEELQNFINDSGRTITIDIPKDNLEGVPEEYKNLPKTRFIRIPYKFLKDRNYNVDDLKEDEAITYYLLDFDENDEYGNPKKYYTVRKINKHTPVGRAYDYWKKDQRLGNVLSSDWLYKDDENIKEGPVDINNTVLLSDVTVTPENNRRFESDTAIPGEYNQQEKYIDPFNIGGTELNIPNNALYNTQGTKGGSSFGTSVNGLRMPDIFNMNMLDLPYMSFQYTPYLWQLEDLEYLNPPGYVPIPNWNIALVYDTGAEGADFADFMKMLAGYGRDNSLRDELMAKLFEPKDYFADPYAGSHYTDTQSFYDAYDNNPYNRIQRESNGIPLYANGGLVNRFDNAGYVTRAIPNGMILVGTADDGTLLYSASPLIMSQYFPDLYKLTPNRSNYILTGSNGNYTPLRSSDTRYDLFIDNTKLRGYKAPIQSKQEEIFNSILPEIVVTPQSNPDTPLMAEGAYNNIANAYDANSKLVEPNIERYAYWDPVNKLARWRQNKLELDRKWFTNEDATKFLLTTAGLGALGAGVVSAPLATTLGLVGGYAGGKAVDKGMQLGTGKTWGEWMNDKTGLPEWFSEFTNPGGVIGGTLGGLSSNYFNGVKNRLNYMLLNTSDKHSPVEPLLRSAKLAITGFDLGRTKARFNYLFRNKEPDSVPLYTNFIAGRSNGMNLPYVGDEYWASFRTPSVIKDPNIQTYYGKDVIYAVPNDRFMSKMPISKGEVKHSLIFGEDLDPNIFKLIGSGELNFGVHANYIKTHPQYRYSKVYEIDTGNGRGFTPSNDWIQDKIKDGSVVDKKVFGTDSSYYQKSSFDDSTVRSATGRDYKYDGAGNLLEVLKIKQPNGKILYAARRLDIYKFNAKDYSKKWGIKDVFQNLGLRYFDKMTAKNVPIVRTNWRVYDNPNDLIEDFKFGVEDVGTKNLDSFMQFIHK